jgi:hypothetical protein
MAPQSNRLAAFGLGQIGDLSYTESFSFSISCRNCGRNFIDEPHTHRRHAVHIAATHFDKLSDETTAKRLSESCPRARLERDVADLGTRYFLD